jgi:hypothetical protein
MKTKLLKKIRKRYQIIKITQLAFDDDQGLKNFVRRNKLPIYQLIDNKSMYLRSENYFAEYDDAYKKLQKWINEDYYHKIKSTSRKQKKVWY